MNKMNYQDGVISKTLLIIISLVIVVVLANGAYYFLNNRQIENKPAIKEQPIVDVVEEEEGPAEEEIAGKEEEPIYDYTDLDILASALPCYLNGTSTALEYFPEGDIKDFFDDISTDDAIGDIDCEQYANAEAYDYLMSLLSTDLDGDGLNLYLENVYNTSDKNRDTDGDSYGDFTEVLNNYDPSDNDGGVSGLASYYPEYSDGVNLTDDDEGGSGNGEESDNPVEEDNPAEEDNPVEEDEVVEINTPEECIELTEGDEVDICLNRLAVLDGSFALCNFSGDFNSCVSINWEIINSLSSIDQCYEYEDLLNMSNFDECIRVRAIAENDVSHCFDIKDNSPVSCVNEVAKANNNAEYCGNVYFSSDSLNSIVAYNNHISCINQLYTTEPEVEEYALLGCQNMAIDNLGEEYLILPIACYSNLAREYSNPEYCDRAAMVTGVFLEQFRDNCLDQL